MGDSDRIPVARIGRSVGLRGDMRLNLLTDFPEQFKKGARFQTDRGELTVARYDGKRGTVRFEGIENVEEAKPLTNLYLYTTKARSQETCHLKEGEYFWFQLIGLPVVEEGEVLGKVAEIERLAGTDYLVVKTDEKLKAQGAPARFLIPYLDRYILQTRLEEGRILTRDARDILDAS
ncbi:MAG: 16S rRNA processing protein RimM [Epsilonproteobacteria bacterium]|jgi:16S rRNA processing protein RimM|nr:16S rRNA processing protein RimM [Campylobacterota bacterium]